MSKIIVLLCLMALIGCEKYKVESDKDEVGSSFGSLKAELTKDDAARLRAICNAVMMKENLLSSLISTRYTFNYTQKNCNESKAGYAEDVTVSIERPYGDYVFEKLNGKNFVFPDVETTTVGVLADICKMDKFISPITTSSSAATSFTTSTNAKHCNATDTAYCLVLEKGVLASSGKYEVHTKEWIKFKLDNPRRGFFIERKVISSASCGSGQSYVRHAVLQ